MKPSKLALLLVGALALAGPATAQDDSTVPEILDLDVFVFPRGTTDFSDLVGHTYDPDNPPFEGAIVILAITAVNPGDQAIYMLRQHVWFPFGNYFTPEPPPVQGDSNRFRKVGAGDTSGAPILIFSVYVIPEFTGPNQARLRGLINYDVRWGVNVFLSTSESPSPDENGSLPVGSGSFILLALNDPALDPPNPPPQADAGSDAVVAVNQTVTLDGSASSDPYNIGFDVLDADIFVKDTIVYTWEWLSGPVRVDPTYPDQINEPALAQVTLNTAGDYVYRLTVTDGHNPLPSSDTVSITVGPPPPVNTAPTARIFGPGIDVIVGSIISLDGTSSSDPEGDALTYRWRQTDELGGELTQEDLDANFQPLSGLQQPISRWQAIKPGSYYFRLLVSDGSLSSAATFTVQVIAAAQAGVKVSSESDAGQDNPNDLLGSSPLGSCGGTGAATLALAFAPLALLGMRRRFP